MSKKTRIFILLLFSIVFIALLIIPFGRIPGTNEAVNILDRMNPRTDDGYMDVLFPFGLFVPVLILIESLTWKFPFTRAQRIIFFLQAFGAGWTWYLICLMTLFSVSPDFLYNIIFLWSTFSLLWSIFLVFPITSKWKWIRWPFSNK